MKIDLHTHTFVSDGALSPNDLLARAVEKGVDVLSITDHDSIGAYEILGDLNDYPIKIITGIEFSTQWRGIGVHIVGLNLDLTSASILQGVARQEHARELRAELITEKLIKAGLPVNYERVKELANSMNVGRPHFAQHLVELGLVKDVAAAFKKYLGNGKIGDVKQCWAELPQIIEWITGAGGTAVLAHPLKYKLTRTKLSRLLDDFIEVGGRGLEVVSGKQTADKTSLLRKLCLQKDLLASCGSDFHQPSGWSELGNMSAIPNACPAVWNEWL
ncbi:MAG: phosphatase [Piscirickettsiaceae bacterium]|nr:MAG: phosphatase [Piscirickettsiaceae bacterium]PCI65979.1 MAG: phosphatase [Piscirickettsiaceae bacterium]